MAQKFKDIQVSNKGMIKLIRENGNDYIFPASKITSVGYREKKTTDLLMKRGVGSLAGFIGSKIIDAYIDSIPNKKERTEPSTIYLTTKDDCFDINTPYTDELHARITTAQNYSKEIEQRKNGIFE